MNFRIYVSGLLLVVVYQLAIAAVVIYFAVHCNAAGAAEKPDRDAVATIEGDTR